MFTKTFNRLISKLDLEKQKNGPTHNHKEIDHIFASKKLKCLQKKMKRIGGSDHHSIMAIIQPTNQLKLIVNK